MKIYIASKYIKHNQVNRLIANLLVKHGYDVFLPESINVDAITRDEQTHIAIRCYAEIESSDVLLVVQPYGRSVSAEIGYAINNKLKYNSIKIISFHFTDEDREEEEREAMIVPFCDYDIDVFPSGYEEMALNRLLEVLDDIRLKIS